MNRHDLVPQSEPQRLIMIGYDSLEKLVADGKIRLDDIKTLELQFNFGNMFKDVLYIVPFGRKNEERRLTDTIVYRELAFERNGSGFLKLVSGLSHIRRAVNFLNRAVSEFKPDAVQTVGPHYTAALALLAQSVRRLPKVCFIEAYWEDILPWQTYFPKTVKLLLPYWYRLVYRLFERYSGAPSLAPSYYSRRGMDEARISPWIQALDLSEVMDARAQDAPESLHQAAHPRVVVLGRLHPEKLAPDALEIFAQAVGNDVKGSLVFVGDGSDRDVIQSRAAALGLSDRVVITGQVSHRIAMAALKACDFSIAPMQGSALLETLAAGLPTVAYDHETHAALIDDGINGVLVRHRDCEAGARALRMLLTTPERAKAIGQAAYQRVEERYNVTAMRDLLKRAFNDAYADRTPRTTPVQHQDHAGVSV